MTAYGLFLSCAYSPTNYSQNPLPPSSHALIFNPTSPSPSHAPNSSHSSIYPSYHGPEPSIPTYSQYEPHASYYRDSTFTSHSYVTPLANPLKSSVHVSLKPDYELLLITLFHVHSIYLYATASNC